MGPGSGGESQYKKTGSLRTTLGNQHQEQRRVDGVQDARKGDPEQVPVPSTEAARTFLTFKLSNVKLQTASFKNCVPLHLWGRGKIPIFPEEDQLGFHQ